MTDALLTNSEAVALAVLATFDPNRLDPSSTVIRELLEWYAIDVRRADGAAERMLSESARVEVLGAALRRDGRSGLIEARQAVTPHYETPLQAMLDAFVLGTDVGIDERNEDELTALLHVERWSTGALARARQSGERSLPSRDEIEGRLRVLDVARPIADLLRGGFVGRKTELGRLHDFRRRAPEGKGLRGRPAFVVFGVGGMGKSTLVARFVQDVIGEARDTGDVWAYLDFDRATLAPRRGGGREQTRADRVFDDLLRQVGAQRPWLRSELESDSAMFRQDETGRGLESVGFGQGSPRQAMRLARTLRRALKGGQLVVVLDTFEEVERQDVREARDLYELFDALALELPSLRLVVSGRAPAGVFRTTEEYELRVGELSPADALELLQTIVGDAPTIDEETAALITDQVGRSPLSLRLAGRVLRDEGVAAFTDADRRARTLGHIRDEFVRGFLYHRIIDHVEAAADTPRGVLEDVARAGLVLRQITADAIRRVLLPALEVTASPELAGRLHDALGAEVALAQRAEPGTLVVRTELRGPALAALNLADAALVRRVRERALDFYPAGSEAAEHAYHRLALGDPLAGLGVELSPEVLASLEPSFDDLPTETAEALRKLRAGDAAARAELDSEREQLVWEQEVAREVESRLQSGDVRGARQALRARVERSRTSGLHQLEGRVCEAEGDWEGAIAAATRALEAARRAEHPLRVAGAAVRLALLHEWRGEGADALALLRDVEAADLMAGEWGLRLELVLSRLAAAERTGLETDADRWSSGLAARRCLRRADDRVRDSDAVVRLLAAVFGRSEPAYLRDAVQRLGLDPDAPAARVTALAEQLSTWDRELRGPDDPGGPVARAAELVVADGSALEAHEIPTASAEIDAWRAHLSGRGEQASGLLGHAFWALGPPAAVCEALRQFFLYWRCDPPASLVPGSLASDETDTAPSHFLDGRPLDHGRRELQALVSLMSAAYRGASERHRLAVLAGIELAADASRARPLTVIRQLLDRASASGRMVDLVRAMLDDARETPRERPIRELIGARWLASHGLGGGVMTELSVARAADEAGAELVALPEFLGSAPSLSAADKRQIVDQALVLMEQLYVHLPLKRAMYATDPVQRLRLLRHRLPDDRAFHEEMIAVFMSVRDLHTNYILPEPYRSATAVLPFRIGEYFDGDVRRTIVFATSGQDPSFRPGVPVTHWNGVPIDRAVELNARRNAGGNPAAKHARGLQGMTVRPLMMSLPPDEAWVDVRYLDAEGKAQERRFDWEVWRPSSSSGDGDGDGAQGGSDAALRYWSALGLDAANEAANDVIKALFDGKQVRIEEDVLNFLQGGLELPGGPDFDTVSRMPNVFRFGTVQTPSGEVGRIQIHTFNVRDPDAFVEEFVRIARLLPQDRLILDVRGNGGGNIIAGEKLLQTMTDATIEPERLHFINSPLVLEMAEATPGLFGDWLPSLRRAVTTGAVFSQGLPFFDAAEYNRIGRTYPGRVVLLTDAFCYSTTDIFTAGFRDHAIGPILGTMANTGAGGANVFTWELVAQLCEGLPDNPVAKPPFDASFRVAIRRTTRVGANAGVVLEDLGVEPDEVHGTTLRDLLEDDVDLYARAAEMLTGG